MLRALDAIVGARPIQQIEHFSPIKKALQALGSWAVRVASGTDIPDAPSGFRAITREAALRLNVFSEYTYTLETIIQAGQKGMAITSVPVHVNGDLRPSRLVKSIGSYVRRSILTIVRIVMTYKPMEFFLVPGSLIFLAGVLVGARFLYFYFTEGGAGHIQSVVLAAVLLLMGIQMMLFGLIAELQGVNRKLLEDIQWRVRRIDTEPESASASERPFGSVGSGGGK